MNFNAWMWIFYVNARYAWVTIGTISGVVYDLDGFQLWYVGPWCLSIALRVWSRAEKVCARIMCVYRWNDRDFYAKFSDNRPVVEKTCSTGRIILGRGKPKCLERILSTFHFVYNNLTWIALEWNLASWRLTPQLWHRLGPCKKLTPPWQV
jgi:hypothetical protein